MSKSLRCRSMAFFNLRFFGPWKSNVTFSWKESHLVVKTVLGIFTACSIVLGLLLYILGLKKRKICRKKRGKCKNCIFKESYVFCKFPLIDLLCWTSISKLILKFWKLCKCSWHWGVYSFVSESVNSLGIS